MPEVAEEREADRVGRRAVDRVGQRAVAERPLPDAERPHQRLLVADRALVRVGRDDRRVADRLERLLEREQAARLDAVVVRDEDLAAGSTSRGAAWPSIARARGPPRAAPPATGSPRSLSRSRRSVRARSRVMSGCSSRRAAGGARRPGLGGLQRRRPSPAVLRRSRRDVRVDPAARARAGTRTGRPSRSSIRFGGPGRDRRRLAADRRGSGRRTPR